MLKTSIILITLSAVAKGFCDSIIFHPDAFLIKSDWWLARGKYAWNNRTWLEESIFSFVSDGWHLFDAVRIASLLLVVAMLLMELMFRSLELEPDPLISDRPNYNKTFAVIGTLVLAYVYHGIIFQLTFWVL